MSFTEHPKPNFLTCPGVPELGSGGQLTSQRVNASTRRGTPAACPEPRRGAPRASEPSRSPSIQIPNPKSQIPNNNQAAKRRDNPARRQSAEGQERARGKEQGGKKHHFFRWIVLAIIAILLVVTVPAGISLAKAGSSGLAAKGAIGRMTDAVRARDFDAADTALEEAERSLAATREGLRGAGFWRNAPVVGPRIRALEDVAETGRETLEGARPLLGIARDIAEIVSGAGLLEAESSFAVDASRSFADLSPEEKRAILARVSRAVPDLRAAQAKIDVALDRWERIPQNDLIGPIRSALAPLASALPTLKRSLDEAVPLLEVALPLAGYPTPSDFLVFLQNTDEIRATGGFLGTVGTLRMDAGDLTEMSFDDIYNIDNPATGSWTEQAPAFITERMNVPRLFLRDANYTPDFPTSAERMMDFYVREVAVGTGKAPPAPTGVIALNPPVFEELLRITGPITLDEFTFTADSYFDVLEYQVEIGFFEKGIPRNQRKDLVSRLGNELMVRLTTIPAARWPEVLDVLTRALERKQMMIYARDPAFLARLDALGWTGRMKAAEADFLSVVDTNLAALKTDGVMEKHLIYALDASDPSRIAVTLTLRYTNAATGFTEFTTRYRDYVRVYVPEGAEFVSADGAMADDLLKTGGAFKPGRVDVTKELGKTVFGAFWSIEPGKTQELTFRYVLPVSVGDQISSGNYALDWQKQSGNDSTTLTIDAAFPKKVMNASPPESPSEWGDANYRTGAVSETDQRFTVTF